MPRGRPKKTPAPQTSLALPEGELTIKALETWLWDAACAIRGATDAPRYKDFILPLLFFKRLSDVFDDELREHVAAFGDEATARTIVEADHAEALQQGRRPLVRFFVPEACNWAAVRHHDETRSGQGLGEFVTDALRSLARLNPELHGVLDLKDFNERQAGQRSLDDDRLATLVEVLSRHRLGLQDARPDVLGQAYEYLLRKFAEGQGQSAGEFFTPPEVGFLLGRLLDVPPFATVYDPTCGSGGLLIKARLAFERAHPDARSQAPRLYGQEYNPVTYAIARMNMALHDFQGAQMAVGDTFRNPQFRADGAGLTHFDAVVANPMWNQKEYGEPFFANDPWKRFTYGVPPSQSADWGWVQHILASLKDDGRAAVVLDTGAASRGSGSKNRDRERDVRQAVVEADLVEAVILLPENLFYNTTAPGLVLVLSKHKPEARRREVLLVNASRRFVKHKPKNVLPDDAADAIVDVFRAWETRPLLSRVVTLDEIAAADYNLSPSQFVEASERATHRTPEAILHDLATARAAREAADETLARVLATLDLTAAEVPGGA